MLKHVQLIRHMELTNHEGVYKEINTIQLKNPLRDEVVITKYEFNIRIQISLPLEGNFTNLIASLSLLNWASRRGLVNKSIEFKVDG